ncbi:protein UXT-like [Ornithodoros turicata]|uniref:protein UXT-like n=1 Tax=Ornithodoros turicata TaxID=34597 RepID=UPI0031389916
MAEVGLDSKILQYESFLNDVLKEDLRICLRERDKVCSKLADVLQLRTIIQQIEETCGDKFKSQVDLGCNFYVQACVEDTSHILVQVGLGFFVEFTPKEGRWFLDRREELLNTELQRLTKDSAMIKAHIQMVLQGLRELQGIVT